MAREKEYLYRIDVQAPNGRIISPHIAYRKDRFKPWTVDIDWTEMSPAYQDIGHAQAYLRKHYGWRANPHGKGFYYASKSTLFAMLNVQQWHID